MTLNKKYNRAMAEIRLSEQEKDEMTASLLSALPVRRRVDLRIIRPALVSFAIMLLVWFPLRTARSGGSPFSSGAELTGAAPDLSYEEMYAETALTEDAEGDWLPDVPFEITEELFLRGSSGEETRYIGMENILRVVRTEMIADCDYSGGYERWISPDYRNGTLSGCDQAWQFTFDMPVSPEAWDRLFDSYVP